MATILVSRAEDLGAAIKNACGYDEIAVLNSDVRIFDAGLARSVGLDKNCHGEVGGYVNVRVESSSHIVLCDESFAAIFSGTKFAVKDRASAIVLQQGGVVATASGDGSVAIIADSGVKDKNTAGSYLLSLRNTWRDYSLVYAKDRSKIVSTGRSIICASGDTKIWAYGDTKVYLFERSSVVGKDRLAKIKRLDIDLSRPFAGKNVVLTGKMEAGMSRATAFAIIDVMGGTPHGSISRSTDFLIVGEDPGEKVEKAKQYGVEIIESSVLTYLHTMFIGKKAMKSESLEAS